MSRFLAADIAALAPYAPGEQPRDMKYIKLNTNESPYPPAPGVAAAIAGLDSGSLRLYPDPDSAALKEAAAKAMGLSAAQVFAGGGSDEVLAYAFMAFCPRGGRVSFPDITYGFYPVYAGLFGLEAETVPLDKEFCVRLDDYAGTGPVFLANPNAPTGICLAPREIEAWLAGNPGRLLVLDEAYVDFSPGMSCLGLVERYDNLLVVQTMSKSRSLAGLRLGFAFGCPQLIAGLERVKYSFNPYNIGRITAAAGIAALAEGQYTAGCVEQIIATRGRTAQALAQMGFEVLPSGANFLFARSSRISGKALCAALRQRGILVRHFDRPRIDGFVRVSIGTDGDMDEFLRRCGEILAKEATL